MSMSGYREDMETPEVEESPAESRRVNLYVSLAGFALFSILEIVSWFTERGGIFSIVSAFFAVRSQPPVLDIDKDGFQLPFLIVVWLVMVGFCRLFDIRLNLDQRPKALLPILFVIAGGFVANATFGERIITRYMVGHGYSRCVDGDWAQGNGKSRVWFADYVISGVECRQRIESRRDRSWP